MFNAGIYVIILHDQMLPYAVSDMMSFIVKSAMLYIHAMA